jgi:hypothetical protein
MKVAGKYKERERDKRERKGHQEECFVCLLVRSKQVTL